MTNLTPTKKADCDHQASVFIVDDDADVRRAVGSLVRSVDLQSHDFSSAQEFLDQYDPDWPGCLVLDIRMPGMTGIQLQHELRDRHIDLPIIFITAHGEIPIATSAMRDGAVDFLPKPYSPQVLLDRIHEAISLDRQRRVASARRREVESRVCTLTLREREVMEFLADGCSNKVIAKRLGISQKTVDNHRSKVLEKMEVDNPTQLARLVACKEKGANEK